MAWSPDGKTLASPSGDETIRLWNADTGKVSKTLDEPSNRVTCASWSSDGKLLAAACWDKKVYLWNMDNNTFIGAMEGHLGDVYSVAFSPNNPNLLASGGTKDPRIHLWNTEKMRIESTLDSHDGGIHSLVWSPSGDVLASCSDEDTIKLWDINDGKLQRSLELGQQFRGGIAWSSNGRWLASACADATIRIWNPETGRQVHVLEGHSDKVRGLSFSSDSKLMASVSLDGTIRLWRTGTWEMLRVIEEKQVEFNIWQGLAFNPKSSVLAAPAAEDEHIRIWDIDIKAILELDAAAAKVQYKNAKIVLLGDTGVGKSGLAWVLLGNKFKATESTHGREVKVFGKTKVKLKNGSSETREAFLWDMGGQPVFKVIHQLHLNETTLAIIVIDGGYDDGPFAAVRYWGKALEYAYSFNDKQPFKPVKFLVAARDDCGAVAVSPDAIDQIVKELGFQKYISTSASKGKNIENLREAISEAIDWDSLLGVSSTQLFQRIKSFLVDERDCGQLSTLEDLYETFLRMKDVDPETPRLRSQFEICVDQLNRHGLIQNLSFGKYILLKPELLDSYVYALFNAAEKNEEGKGWILENEVSNDEFTNPWDNSIADKIDKKQGQLLLLAAVEELIKHEVVLREETADGNYLVFPSHLTREYPHTPEMTVVEAVFNFEGPVLNIYASLVVRLAHSQMFTLSSDDMWRNTAFFGSQEGGKYGLALTGGVNEGSGKLSLFYDGGKDDVKVQFEKFVEAHLNKRALEGTVLKQRIFVCPNPECRMPLPDGYVKVLQDKDKKEFKCPCGATISIVDPKEQIDFGSKLDEMDRQADSGRIRSAARSVIEGKIATHDFDVFMAYNSKDKSLVEALAKQLRSRGLNPWLDMEQIPPGRWFQDLIQKAIPKVGCAAVIVGKMGLGKWEALELRTFISQCVEKGKPVIPVLLPGVDKLPDELLFLKEIGLVSFDANVDEDKGLDNLAWGIRGKR
ncbi:MAG: TIR domain-containing protein [Planctomycetes bacterium]|nr:TIR domain-containing protein [Planctomycetota bacterium]